MAKTVGADVFYLVKPGFHEEFRLFFFGIGCIVGICNFRPLLVFRHFVFNSRIGTNEEQEKIRLQTDIKAFIPAHNEHLMGLRHINKDMCAGLNTAMPQKTATLDMDATLAETMKKTALYCYNSTIKFFSGQLDVRTHSWLVLHFVPQRRSWL